MKIQRMMILLALLIYNFLKVQTTSLDNLDNADDRRYLKASLDNLHSQKMIYQKACAINPTDGAVEIPSDSLTTTISNGAYDGCTALTTLTFATQVYITTIASEAFKDTSLATMEIPSTITSIASDAFDGKWTYCDSEFTWYCCFSYC